jgi:hypothetical protein
MVRSVDPRRETLRAIQWRLDAAALFETLAAETSVSPHLDILPLRSTSPDWYCLCVNPMCAPTDRGRAKRAGSSTVLT